jgi:hypothetical protein
MRNPVVGLRKRMKILIEVIPPAPSAQTISTIGASLMRRLNRASTAPAPTMP